MSDTRGRAIGTNGEIAEFQGLYGAFHVSEVLLQKIWLKREFAVARARTTDGEPIEVVSPGQWNRLSGPDFFHARLKMGGRDCHGSVEVHFHAQAWQQHRHEQDPAYDDVVLHVVLFPPGPACAGARTSQGRVVPVLVLMDLLLHDLEEYAEDEAVTALSGRDPWPVVERLLALDDSERGRELGAAAERRWREKAHFARLRVERLGWEEACHQTALEILGYRQNRAAMLRAAALHPWHRWREQPPVVNDLLADDSLAWTTRAVRPANHPRRRLQQYAAWMGRCPDWPRRLRTCVKGLPLEVAGTSEGRRRRKEARAFFARELFGGAVTGTRVDTLIVNLVFPFLAVEGAADGARRAWEHWPAGDMPDGLRESARHLRDPRSRAAATNGLLQALLGLQLAALSREMLQP